MKTDDFKTILNDLREKEGDVLVNEFERIFKSRVPKDINDLNAAVLNRDLESIRGKAHFLTTTFITLKFNHGLSLLAEIEDATLNKNEALSISLTDQFINYLNHSLTII